MEVAEWRLEVKISPCHSPWHPGRSDGGVFHHCPGRRRRVAGRAQEPRPAAPLSFNRDIRPILSDNCFACHGPDEKQRETKFHFDTDEGAFAEDGIIVPGNAAKSVLVKPITRAAIRTSACRRPTRGTR